MARTSEPGHSIGLKELLERARDLLAALGHADDDRSRLIAERLRNSVIRPLQATAGQPRSGVGRDTRPTVEGHVPDDVAQRVWELARAATGTQRDACNAAAIAEAVAALQDMALGLSSENVATERLAELAQLAGDGPPTILCARNGPYLIAGVRRVLDWLGQPLPVRPQLALCRCGASTIKPLCDGSHARVGFTDEKDPHRVPDRLDRYVGQQVTILDNRGTCQHSGFCTERLATVFRLREEPFVAPSGGRMDEIIRSVRDCPSGALSYAIDGVEDRTAVDWHIRREPTVEVSKDGPYRVTGGIDLLDWQGRAVPRNTGASLEHYALCRCGRSQNKPFCSGMHWYVEFRDPVPGPDRTPTMFEWAGGLPALTRMTRLFYEKHVPQDPLLAPLFANMSADHPQRVAKWLGEVFGGPPCYSEEYGGYPRMLSQHRDKCLSEEQRSRWVALLLQSAREAGLPNDPEFRSAFQSYIEWGSRLAVENSQTAAQPPQHMPMPRWDWNTGAGPPGSRISALPGADQQPDQPDVALPAPDETVSFERHIRPLFRPRDRRSMQFAFDLWSCEDVRQHAAAILERLRNGTMPCDGAWPTERTDTFARWTDSGMAE
jgi:CDGSH-type Zn-finger protein/truncated hemoglobin YjbI